MDNLLTIIIEQNDTCWDTLLAKGLKTADHIEFNVLFKNPGKVLDDLLAIYGGNIVATKQERYSAIIG